MEHSAMLTSIPSPSQSVWQLGPIPVRAYALCLLAGILLAVWLGTRRWTARGGRPGDVVDVAVWAVPFGIIGARLYHVATDWQNYVGPGRNPLDAVRIWDGGIGIWGAIAAGALGAWVACRRKGIPLPAMADALAPGIALGQAVGRWGNWFNQELYGRPTNLPWAVEIDPQHRPDGLAEFATYHPAFLYESLWNVGVAVVLIVVARRFRLRSGHLFASYVVLYTLGRGWIETLRIDPAHHILGLRLNIWTSTLAFLATAAVVWATRRSRPDTEASPVVNGGRQ